MKRTYPLFIICLLWLTACATNPTNRWGQGAIALDRAEETILVLHETGFISDEKLISLEPTIDGAKASIDRAKTYLPEGGPVFEVVWEGFTAYLLQLQQAEAEALGRK